MGRFRKKPIVIDAEQWKGGARLEGMEPYHGEYSRLLGTFVVRTLEGDMVVRLGDWIITGVQGEKYPCKPDIFEATYEEVHDEETIGVGR